MDIKQTRPSLSQEVISALDQKSGSSDSPSFMAQFVIRTMGNDLKNAALQAAAKLTAAKTVSPPVAPTPYLKIVSPPILPATSKTLEPAKIPSWPPKEIIEPKTALFPAPPRPKVAEEQAQRAKEAQKKQEQEQKAADRAAKEAQKKLELEKKAAKALAAAAAKEARKKLELEKKTAAAAAKEVTRIAKEKIIKAQEAQKQELRDLLTQAKLKLAAKEFNAAIVDAQKIIGSPVASWLAKWRAKRLISEAQKGIAQKEAEPPISSDFIRVMPPAPPKAAPAPDAVPRGERSELYGAVPVNLPTIDEIPSLKPGSPTPPTPPAPVPPAPPFPPTPKPALTETPTPKISPPQPTPQKLLPQMPAILTPDLLETKVPEPEAVLDMKKVLLVGLISIAILALIVWGLWFFLGRPPAQVTQTPSPSPSLMTTPTPIPTPTPLFKADSQKIFTLKTGQEKANFQEAIMQLVQTDEPAENFIYLLFKDSQGKFPSLDKLASSTEIDLFNLPTQVNAGPLKDQLEMNSFSFFAYSQSRPDSSPFISGTNSGRIGIIILIKNATSTDDLAKSLTDLEQLMFASLKILLPDAKNNFPTKPVFLDNTYNNTAVRYINLPEPSLSLDYAILNNKLIFATSKQSMHAIIDRILSQTNP